MSIEKCKLPKQEQIPGDKGGGTGKFNFFIIFPLLAGLPPEIKGI